MTATDCYSSEGDLATEIASTKEYEEVFTLESDGSNFTLSQDNRAIYFTHRQRSRHLDAHPR